MTVTTLRRSISGTLRMDASMESQLPREASIVVLRTNIGALKDEPPTKLTEAEALELLAVVFKDPRRAINRLKKGEKLVTRYASYVAQMI